MIVGIATANAHEIDENLPGPSSPYTALILDLLHHWPPRQIQESSPEDSNPVHLRCIETQGQRFYIGLEQTMTINASLQSVEKVMDGFDHYQELFDGFDDIHVVSRDSNRFRIFWEQHIPLFFIPNIKYETWYLVDNTHPNRVIYRYQLAQSGKIKTNDGLIVIENAGPNKTRYIEYDFFDAEWGILKDISPGRIWTDSVEGIYLSDVAIRLKAEHPDLSYSKIVEESKRTLKQFPIEGAISHKIQASTYFGSGQK